MNTEPSSFVLPDEALIRMKRVCEFTPFAPATLWRRVRDGSFPKPIKVSDNITAWRWGDVRRWLLEQGEAGNEPK